MSPTSLLFTALLLAAPEPAEEATSAIEVMLGDVYGALPKLEHEALGEQVGLVATRPLVTVEQRLRWSSLRPASKEPRRKLCIVVGDERPELLTALEVTDAEVERSGLFDGLSPFLGFDLKAAGLTSDRAFLPLDAGVLGVTDEGEAAIDELIEQHRKGSVKFRARLSRVPPPARTAIARIETDKGPLGVKVLLSEAQALTVEDKLILELPSRRTIELPLGEVPLAPQVILALTSLTGMPLEKEVQLRAGAAGFVVEYPAELRRLPELARTVSVVPLDGEGRALGDSQEGTLVSTVRVRRPMTPLCEWELGLRGLGVRQSAGVVKLHRSVKPAEVVKLLVVDTERERLYWHFEDWACKGETMVERAPAPVEPESCEHLRVDGGLLEHVRLRRGAPIACQLRPERGAAITPRAEQVFRLMSRALGSAEVWLEGSDGKQGRMACSCVEAP